MTNNYVPTGQQVILPYSLLAEDGIPPSPVATVDRPTDAGWFIHPAQSDSGGMFYVSCCQPLP